MIGYQTPKTFRKVAETDKVIWLLGPHLTAWIDRLLEACPPQDDPLWAGHPETSRHLINAGAACHRAMVGKALADPEKSERGVGGFPARVAARGAVREAVV